MVVFTWTGGGYQVSSQGAKRLRIVLGLEIELVTEVRTPDSDPNFKLHNTCPHLIGSLTGS